MARDDLVNNEPQSPFDPYIVQALDFIAQNGQLTMSALPDACVRELRWLPGFADVVLGMLKTNGLVLVNDWEPGKIHISDRGQLILFAKRDTLVIT